MKIDLIFLLQNLRNKYMIYKNSERKSPFPVKHQFRYDELFTDKIKEDEV